MIENEYKVMLNEEEYKKIFEWGTVWKGIEQINFYYYDEEENVIKNNITIRVRSDSSKLYLQIKLPVYNCKSLHCTKEFQKEIKSLPYCISGEEIKKMCGVDVGDVLLDGWLFTERNVCTKYEGIIICLDKNTYCGTTDYELELELMDEKNVINVIDALKKIGIDFGEEVNGKFSRYTIRAKGNYKIKDDLKV